MFEAKNKKYEAFVVIDAQLFCPRYYLVDRTAARPSTGSTQTIRRRKCLRCTTFCVQEGACNTVARLTASLIDSKYHALNEIGPVQDRLASAL